MVWVRRGVEAIAGLVAIGVLVSARAGAAHWNVLILLWMVGLPIQLVAVMVWALRRSIVSPKAFSPWQWASVGIWVAASIVSGLAVQRAMVPVQFSPDELVELRSVIALMSLAWIGLAFVHRTEPRWMGNAVAVVALALFGRDLVWEAWPPHQEAVALRSPFEVDAYVFHGGQTPLLNHHAVLQQQHHALDLVVLRNDRDVDGPADALESHACWGVPLVAPAKGTVVAAVSDRPDNPIGETDTDQIVGNHVILEIAPDRYLLLAHLQQDSVAVSVGDPVDAGELLGRCGNSGNTSGPHLHLQLMTKPTFSNADDDLFTVPMALPTPDGPRPPTRGDTLLGAPAE